MDVSPLSTTSTAPLFQTSLQGLKRAETMVTRGAGRVLADPSDVKGVVLMKEGQILYTASAKLARIESEKMDTLLRILS